MNGIDVSAVGQGANFDWGAWKGKIQFAAVKVSEGLTYADPDARRNIAGARSIGCKVIGYHFVHGRDPGVQQANWFMSRCKPAGLERGDMLALDVEQAGMDQLSASMLWAQASAAAATLHGHFAAWPSCYTDITLADVAPATVSSCPLWLANPSAVTSPSIGPWKFISLEQTGQRGVDTDQFYGDAKQFAALCIPAPNPQPARSATPGTPTRPEAVAAAQLLGRYFTES